MVSFLVEEIDRVKKEKNQPLFPCFDSGVVIENWWYRDVPGHRNYVLDPASVCLSTHWWSQHPACQCCFCKPSRWGWVLLERTRILSEIQFTTHFIEFLVVETKRFVGSFVNVILMWQTCGQRSSRAAESKRRALGNYCPERICYMFLMSKCRGDWDLVLCTTSGLAKREPQRSCDFWKKPCFDAGNIGFCHCAAVLQTKFPKLCTDLDLSLLYILVLGKYSKFARKNNFLALGVCFPQPCSSAGRRFAASRSRVQNYWQIVLFPQQKLRWNAL